jgi:hypothetical protein
LRDSDTSLTRSSSAASARSRSPVPSREPSSTTISSNAIPSNAATVRAWNAPTMSSSSCIGVTTLKSPGSRTGLA